MCFMCFLGCKVSVSKGKTNKQNYFNHFFIGLDMQKLKGR